MVAGIIKRAQSAARAALSDNRSAQAPATFASRPDLLAQLRGSLQGLGVSVAPAQQDVGQAGSQSAVTGLAGMHNLPSDAMQYIMSGILGRWFRQQTPTGNDSVPHALCDQQPGQAKQPGMTIKKCIICVCCVPIA